MSNIKLFVCCHKQADVPKHPLLYPVQVGAEIADTHFPGYCYDDTGENISFLNRSYCELTAQYWAWKNVEVDYYGFFHYRRYLYPDSKAKRPYRIENKPTLEALHRLNYDRFEELISHYDMILPMGEEMYVPVREQYAKAPHQHSRDLTTVEKIVQARTPELIPAMESYLSGTIHYFGNIFIMRRELFDEYCDWLFPLLAEFDQQVDTSGYTEQEKRVDGYIAERMLGIWYVDRKSKVRTLELPKVQFGGQSKIMYYCLPPGTRRRAAIKKLMKG